MNEITRRRFITNAAKSYLGVTVLPMLGSTIASPAFAKSTANGAGKADHVIFLNMAGGMSHIDTFDPKPNKKEIQGPVESIATAADGIQITQYLPETAKVMNHACVINSMTSKQGAHEQGQYMLHRSYAMRGTISHPSLGAWVNKLKGRKNPDIPGFVSIGGSPDQASGGFFGARYSGVPLGRPDQGLKNSTRAHTCSEDDFNRRLALADTLNKNFHDQFSHPTIKEYDNLYEEAIRLMQSKDLKAFDINKEPETLKNDYGKNHFGQGCLLARRLVEHGVRFVEVTLGGWDTHYDNFTSVEARCQILDIAYATLIKDLHSRGLLQNTLVVLATEFGRSPEIVAEHQNGRDHYPAAYSCVLAGGGIKGGTSYGRTDSKGLRVKDKPVEPKQLNATIAHALGIPTNEKIHSPSGRPFTIGNNSSPVVEIFA
ncbi:Protein of unknown function [Rubritalea squalenifaciens DSM 18772]|uniref:Tat (Twin-arginine translocation) pathway signal sequence n=1 Tax=Rubritalea squalenifaciens DSM 18772 TaxID=1123071 RepID=A0A1M6GJQ8_9BACT|nr:DUF1501 domain-containing protein [Rubritalea squalenifaciens]SHJ10120.1 Protein of unknown function [Rubritalea squalenifaciens DSM 18772]